MLLSNGTYSGINLTIKKSNVTLRGSGSTVVQGEISIGDWHPWDNHHKNPSIGNHTNITAGLNHGSTQITLASTSGFAVGALIVIDQLNDSNSSLEGERLLS